MRLNYAFPTPDILHRQIPGLVHAWLDAANRDGACGRGEPARAAAESRGREEAAPEACVEVLYSDGAGPRPHPLEKHPAPRRQV